LKSTRMVIIFFLCCCSCASKAEIRENRPNVYLTGSSKYFLLPPGNIENTMDMAQRISAEWQGKDYSFNVFPKLLKPEYIIADFQLCFYNTSALTRALEECGLSIENSENNRRILSGKTVIIEINKSRDTVRLVNHLRGYTYTLEGNFK